MVSVRARSWLALTLPPVAWFGFQQGLSALLHARCDLAGWGIVWGVASLAACALAAWFARPLARRGGDLLASLWLARRGLAIAGIFGLAITFQTLAILLVPPCVG
jgi:predicted Co/Zn/Cd cation transporter (cation efflux family)